MAIDIGTPLFVLLENPLLKPLLVLVEWEVPVFGLLLGEWVAVDGVVWVNEFVRRKGCSALLALVAIGACCVATWAFAADVAVGEKLLSFRVVELLGSLLDELAVVVEMAEEIRCQLVVDLARPQRVAP